MTDKDAMKLALDALEYWDVHGKLHQPTEEAITAIKEALAQPEQEPVGQLLEAFGRGQVIWFNKLKDESMLYAHPPQRTEQNFCSRCGKRTADLTTIHTCTPPQENT